LEDFIPLPKRIVLTGFMGTGKSCVGKLLADKLGYTFIDTDQIICEKSGLRVADYFAQHGEATFRALESQVLQEALAQEGVVVAVGGGAILSAHNRRLIQKLSQPILLTASVASILQRLAHDTGRPLLKGDDKEGQIQALLQKRAPLYFKIEAQIHTDDLSISEVVEKILKILSQNPNCHYVELGTRRYPIYFEHDALPNLSRKLRQHFSGKKIIILTNSTVGKIYLKTIATALTKHFEVAVIKIPDGERYKNLNTVSKIYAQLVKLKADRQSLLLALGGGVVGDIAGFVAGTYLRGIPFVQVPTTLLAQVDSSVGGKTGVDLASGKNLVGVFHQPKLVFIDTLFLKTLPKRELLAGMAEVIKYGAIRDEGLFARVEALAESILQGEYELLKTIVRRSCEIKADIVEQDEFETTGLRSLLNFGHTVGHAVETVTGYRRYLHGEAIAMGMVFAAKKSLRLGFCHAQEIERLERLLKIFNLPTELPKLPLPKLKRTLLADKKRVSSFINFVYLRKVGEAFVQKTKVESIFGN